MSAPTPTPNNVKPSPKKTMRRGHFLPIFVIVLAANLLLTLVVFAIGIGSGYEGQLAFAPHFSAALTYLFGGWKTALFGGLTVATLLLFLWGAYRLSKAGQHAMVAVIAAIALVLGMVIAQVGSWGVAVPIALLLAFTAIQVWVITTITGRR